MYNNGGTTFCLRSKRDCGNTNLYRKNNRANWGIQQTSIVNSIWSFIYIYVLSRLPKVLGWVGHMQNPLTQALPTKNLLKHGCCYPATHVSRFFRTLRSPVVSSRSLVIWRSFWVPILRHSHRNQDFDNRTNNIKFTQHLFRKQLVSIWPEIAAANLCWQQLALQSDSNCPLGFIPTPKEGSWYYQPQTMHYSV